MVVPLETKWTTPPTPNANLVIWGMQCVMCNIMLRHRRDLAKGEASRLAAPLRAARLEPPPSALNGWEHVCIKIIFVSNTVAPRYSHLIPTDLVITTRCELTP